MKAFNNFKISTLVFGLISIIVQLGFIFHGIIEAIDNWDLKGGARAQSEFFALPLLFIGGIFGLFCVLLLLSNIIVDIVRQRRQLKTYKYNSLAYFLLIAAILTPWFGSSWLVDLMYSGWN